MREYRDASDRLSFDLSGQANAFGIFAERMIALHGNPVEKLCDAMSDHRYWDFDVKGTIVVLHSDVMAGVSIHVEDGTHEELLREIAMELSK